MTAIQLYKFIAENDIELMWNNDKLICWVSRYDIIEFTDLIGANSAYFDEGGIEIRWQGYNFAIDLTDICIHFDINPEEICKKEL